MAKTNLEELLSKSGLTKENAPAETLQSALALFEKMGIDPDAPANFATEPFICSICGKAISDEFGNNAQPVNDGVCCNECNANVVIPARLSNIK